MPVYKSPQRRRSLRVFNHSQLGIDILNPLLRGAWAIIDPIEAHIP